MLSEFLKVLSYPNNRRSQEIPSTMRCIIYAFGGSLLFLGFVPGMIPILAATTTLLVSFFWLVGRDLKRGRKVSEQMVLHLAACAVGTGFLASVNTDFELVPIVATFAIASLSHHIK